MHAATAGFFAGLLVSVFSKTLVLLAGIGMIIIQVRLGLLASIIVPQLPRSMEKTPISFFFFVVSSPHHHTPPSNAEPANKTPLIPPRLPINPGRRTQRDRPNRVPQAQGAGALLPHPGSAEPPRRLQALVRRRLLPLGIHVLLRLLPPKFLHLITTLHGHRGKQPSRDGPGRAPRSSETEKKINSSSPSPGVRCNQNGCVSRSSQLRVNSSSLK